MKHIIIILFTFFTFNNPSYSQIEFAPIGSEWVMNDLYEIGFPPLKSNYTYLSESDTLINNLSFRKVGEWLFHQDDYEIYYLFEDTLRLVYDFGAQLNDTLEFELLMFNEIPTKSNFVVVAIDSIIFGNETLKKFTCNFIGQPNSSYYFPYVYLEKMGSERKLTDDLYNIFTVPGFEPDNLRCFIENNNIYKSDWFQSFGDYDCKIITKTAELNLEDHSIYIYPNPSSGTIKIDSHSNDLHYAEIRSLEGYLIKGFRFSQEHVIDISFLDQGMYTITFWDSINRLLGIEKIIKF